MGLEPEQVSKLFFMGIGNLDLNSGTCTLSRQRLHTTKNPYDRVVFRARALRTDLGFLPDILKDRCAGSAAVTRISRV